MFILVDHNLRFPLLESILVCLSVLPSACQSVLLTYLYSSIYLYNISIRSSYAATCRSSSTFVRLFFCPSVDLSVCLHLSVCRPYPVRSSGVCPSLYLIVYIEFCVFTPLRSCVHSPFRYPSISSCFPTSAPRDLATRSRTCGRKCSLAKSTLSERLHQHTSTSHPTNPDVIRDSNFIFPHRFLSAVNLS